MRGLQQPHHHSGRTGDVRLPSAWCALSSWFHFHPRVMKLVGTREKVYGFGCGCVFSLFMQANYEYKKNASFWGFGGDDGFTHLLFWKVMMVPYPILLASLLCSPYSSSPVKNDYTAQSFNLLIKSWIWFIKPFLFFSFLFFFLFGFQSLPFGMSHWDAFRSPGWYRNLAYAWHTLKNFQVFNSVQTTGSSTVPLYLMLDGRDWLRAIRLVTLVLRATKNYVRLLQFGDLYLSINRLGPCCGANVLENQFTNYLKIFIIYLFRNVIIYEVLFGLVFHTVANRLKLGNLSLHFSCLIRGEECKGNKIMRKSKRNKK